jgi:hypothetical protein
MMRLKKKNVERNQWNIGLAVKALLYPYKDENTSSIFRKHTY